MRNSSSYGSRPSCHCPIKLVWVQFLILIIYVHCSLSKSNSVEIYHILIYIVVCFLSFIQNRFLFLMIHSGWTSCVTMRLLWYNAKTLTDLAIKLIRNHQRNKRGTMRTPKIYVIWSEIRRLHPREESSAADNSLLSRRITEFQSLSCSSVFHT